MSIFLFSFGLPFFIRSQHFHVGQGLFFPIEANHIFPFFVPKRSFLFDQIRSWLLIFSFVYIPPYQAALLDLFENKYTFSQGSTPDFIGNLIFQKSSQKSVFVKDHIYNGYCAAPEILPFHSYCSGCTQEGFLSH